jgi:hypothetical protein
VLRPEVERMVPLMELRLVQPAVPCPVPAAARQGVPVGPHRGCPAHPSAAVARRVWARELALPLPAELAVAQLPAEPMVVARPTAEPVAGRLESAAVQDVAAGPRREVQRASAAQPRAARAELVASGAGVLQPAVREAVWDAAAEPQPAAASAAGVRQPEAGAVVLDAAEAALQQAAVVPDVAAAALRQAAAVVRAAVAAVRLREEAARDEAVAPRREAPGAAARPSAAAWAAPLCRPCLRAARLAPSPKARFAPAREEQRIARL